jgi:hypothetical protein
MQNVQGMSESDDAKRAGYADSDDAKRAGYVRQTSCTYLLHLRKLFTKIKQSNITLGLKICKCVCIKYIV